MKMIDNIRPDLEHAGIALNGELTSTEAASIAVMAELQYWGAIVSIVRTGSRNPNSIRRLFTCSSARSYPETVQSFKKMRSLLGVPNLDALTYFKLLEIFCEACAKAIHEPDVDIPLSAVVTFVQFRSFGREAGQPRLRRPLGYWKRRSDFRGGDKLSRGLTLEGLTVSYFLRPSRMYDSLMQMGRWFGYRPGYVDLCRLYMTPDFQLWFRHVATAAEELRGEIEI